MFTEYNNSPRETFSVTGTSIAREFQGLWEDRFDFADEIARTPYDQIGARVYVSSIEFFPLEEACAAQDDSDRTFTSNRYEKVRAVVKYSNDPEADGNPEGGGGGGGGGGSRQNQGDGTYITYDAEGALEMHSLKRSLVWDDKIDGENIPIAQDIGALLRYPVSTHRLAWHKVSSPNFALIDANVGKVNNSTFVIPVSNIACAQGTLVFEDWSLGTEVSYESFANPMLVWKLNMNFMKRDMDWNYFYRDNVKPGWDKLRYKKDQGTAAQYFFEYFEFREFFIQG